MKKIAIPLSFAAIAITLCSMSDKVSPRVQSKSLVYDSIPAPPAALPVMETYVSGDILSKLKSASGTDTLYDITAIKNTDSTGTCSYVIRSMKSGMVKTSWADSTGTVTANNTAMSDNSTGNGNMMKDTTGMNNAMKDTTTKQ